MRTLDLSAAIFRPGRSSYWSQSDRERVRPTDVYKEFYQAVCHWSAVRATTLAAILALLTVLRPSRSLLVR